MKRKQIVTRQRAAAQPSPLRIQRIKYLFFIWFDIFSPFICLCRGKLDLLTADERDGEDISADGGTEAATMAVIAQTLSRCFKGLFLLQGNWGVEEGRRTTGRTVHASVSPSSTVIHFNTRVLVLLIASIASRVRFFLCGAIMAFEDVASDVFCPPRQSTFFSLRVPRSHFFPLRPFSGGDNTRLVPPSLTFKRLTRMRSMHSNPNPSNEKGFCLNPWHYNQVYWGKIVWFYTTCNSGGEKIV